MEKLFKKPIVICVMALICCALWGSAFPCVKIGYELLQIKTTGSQILFAGYRFFGAGILTFLMGCIIEKRVLTLKKSAIPYVAGIGIFQTTLQYIFFYIGMANTTGVKGSVINASNAFVSIIVAHFLVKGERMTWKKGVGCILGFAGVVIINLSPGAWGSGFSLKGEGMVAICTIIGVDEICIKKGEGNGNHSVPVDGGRRCSDWFWIFTRWKYQWIYREVIFASILYGDAVGGCVQSVDDIIKV